MWLYAAAIAGYIGIFAGSTPYGWSSPVLPLYDEENSPLTITEDEGAWIASAFMLGNAIGPLMSLVISHLTGRKTLLIAASLPWFIGWTMIIFARSPWELFVSRIISGTGTGASFSVLPMYLGEIAPANIRGILLTMITMSQRLAILFAYAIYPFVSIQTSALISLVLPVPFVCCFMWLPESPYYLIRCGRHEEAAESLAALRGTANVQTELQTIKKSVKVEMASSGGLRELFCVPGNCKSMNIGLVLRLFQQCSGNQAIMMYTQTIFDQANVGLEGKYLAIIMGVIQVLGTLLCTWFVDRQGRRPALLFSAIGTMISTSAVAIYFHLQYFNVSTDSIEWLPATGCMMYVVFFCCGYAPLPTTMNGELFSTNVKSLGCAINVSFANFVGFLVGKSYQVVSQSIGVYVAFWIFTIANFWGSIFIYFWIPETKGKTLQEIQEELHHKKGQNVVTSL
ncbi:facilitated trehalose transporter Tret1 [Fopius arisanus]|uniref:Facilitated trehalose transporter Tret1 n=1 Tax=Fopius arisanus TaxID=64838 RepID=A0A9R1UAY9_9HYME|nr:PREDICTED: facilitated trehalose transporter Tret1-like [Fopius arisanus]